MDFEADAGEAFKVLQDTVPAVVKDVPELQPLVPFLPAIGILLQVIDAHVGADPGTSTGDAVAAAATALRISTAAPAAINNVQLAVTNAHAQAAGNAVDSGSLDAVLAALAALPKL